MLGDRWVVGPEVICVLSPQPHNPLLCTFFALQFFFSKNVLLLNKKNNIQNYSRG